MKGQSVSIAEGKKSFSKAFDDAISHKEEVIVTRRALKYGGGYRPL